MCELDKALNHYDQSISLCPNNKRFCKKIKLKKQQVKDEINSKNPALDINNNPADTSIRARLAETPNIIHEKDLKDKDNVTGEELSLYNKLMDLMACNFQLPKQLNYLDKSMPSFDLDSYPAFCDIPRCKQRINNYYEHTKARSMSYMSYKSGIKPDIMDYFQRLGNNLPETIDWYEKSKDGDINIHPISVQYNPTVLHSFSNEIIKSQVLTPGTTYVAIGFTDLGLFHTAKFNAEFSSERPFKWFGYEASAYCCAKTAIITSMMMMNASSDHVLQVWYSATWSKETLKSFKSAIEMILNGKLLF